MGKLKTNRSIAKRFRITKKGKVVHRKAFKGHLLAKKARTRKLSLRKPGIVSSKKQSATIKRSLPYA